MTSLKCGYMIVTDGQSRWRGSRYALQRALIWQCKIGCHPSIPHEFCVSHSDTGSALGA
jgi:hypothetical protein